jgi:hypothetical protein
MSQRLRIDFEPSRDASRGPLQISFRVQSGVASTVQLDPGAQLGLRMLDGDRTRDLPLDAWIDVEGGRVRFTPVGEAIVSNIANSGWAAPELEVCLAGVLPGRGVRRALPRDEGREIIVGRDTSADVSVEDDHVSRKHLTIVLREDAYIVTNHGTHGSLLNGRALLEPTRLQHNDQLRIGTATVIFRSYDHLLQGLEPAAQTGDSSEGRVDRQTKDAQPMGGDVVAPLANAAVAINARAPHASPLMHALRAGWLPIALAAFGILVATLVVLGLRIALR